MARKNTLVYQLAAAQSLAANFISPVTVVRFMDNCSYQINVTTTNSTGTFAVEVSDDYAVNEASNNVVTNPGNWAALTLAGGTPTVAAANDVIVINLNQLPFNAMRLHYTSTIAGTGVADIFIVNKEIGG
jgi:hypothetical protein